MGHPRVSVLRSLFIGAVLAVMPASAQETGGPAARPAEPARVPFGVGERLEYQVKYKNIPVGSGEMEVLPMDTVRGVDTWHTIFRLHGRFLFYSVNDKYESWSDSHTLASLRYRKDIDEGSYEPKHTYEIFPDRREYTEDSKPPKPSVEHPLDDGSFLYFLRTVPLRVGMDTTFNDYFMADRNPVRFKVVRKDTIDVPAGRFPALVVQPIFQSKFFSDGGHAEVWLSDDENRIMLQMKSSVRFGSLNLYLKSYHPPQTATPPVPANGKPPTDTAPLPVLPPIPPRPRD
ncbi:MAG TPA: DUF3108 domain-containing protein [Gemmatimonadaceae bacterium]|nr:DUF3108 domain-containing protein [Gemmatimonadaceae bacterium]